MKNISTLYSVLTKNTAMKMPKNEGKGRLYLSLGIIALSCIMIPCCLIVGYVSMVITRALTAANAPANGLLAEIHIMSAFSMIFGMLVIFSVLFFSSDREHLMALPFKSTEILTAKFLYSYMAESVMEFMVLAAMFVGFFIAYKFNVISVIAAFIGVILIPLLPLLYCGIIALLIMAVLKRVRSRKIFNHVSTIMLIAFVILFLFSFKDMGSITMDNYVTSLSDGSNLFTNVLNKVFFTVPFLLKAIETGSILDLIIYIVLNLATFGVMILIGHFTYHKGLQSVGALGSKRKHDALLDKAYRKHSPFASYVKKEYRNLLRVKAYSGNCVFINLIWPLGLVLFASLNKDKSSFSKFVEHFNSGNSRAFVLVTIAVVAISFIASAMNSLASTAFTREGAHLSIIHYLPIDYKSQIKAKGFVSFSITYPTLLITLIIWSIYTNMNILVFLYYAILSFLCFYITMIIGLYLDSAHPHSDWDDEYSALRGNLNSFFDMGIVMVLAVIICGIGFALFNFAGLSILGFNIYTLAIILCLSLIAFLFGSKRIQNNLEDLR